MKRSTFALSLMIGVMCCAGACAAEGSGSTGTGEMPTDIVSEDAGSDTETESANRASIANALGIEEDSRNIRFITNCLDSIGAGKIQNATKGEENGEDVLYMAAEDGTDYCIYLTKNGSVDAVQDMDTGRWVVISQR